MLCVSVWMKGHSSMFNQKTPSLGLILGSRSQTDTLGPQSRGKNPKAVTAQPSTHLPSSQTPHRILSTFLGSLPACSLQRSAPALPVGVCISVTQRLSPRITLSVSHPPKPTHTFPSAHPLLQPGTGSSRLDIFISGLFTGGHIRASGHR